MLISAFFEIDWYFFSKEFMYKVYLFSRILGEWQRAKLLRICKKYDYKSIKTYSRLIYSNLKICHHVGYLNNEL